MAKGLKAPIEQITLSAYVISAIYLNKIFESNILSSLFFVSLFFILINTAIRVGFIIFTIIDQFLWIKRNKEQKIIKAHKKTKIPLFYLIADILFISGAYDHGNWINVICFLIIFYRLLWALFLFNEFRINSKKSE